MALAEAPKLKLLYVFDREFWYVDGFPEWKLVSFLSRVSFDDDTGCWNWIAGRSASPSSGRSPYGAFSYENKNVPAHRIAWVALRGEIPAGHHIHHICENTLCVNPEHLLPVTPQEHVSEYTPKNPVARNYGKTHCRRGHPYSGDNLREWVDRHGIKHRRCVECQKAWARAKYKIQRAQEQRNKNEATCPNGHLRTPENTYLYRGVRCCRDCHKANSAKYYKKKRTQRPKRQKVLPTHCPQGHEYNEENTGVTRGRRFCKTCNRERAKAWYEKRKKQVDRAEEARVNEQTLAQRRAGDAA